MERLSREALTNIRDIWFPDRYSGTPSMESVLIYRLLDHITLLESELETLGTWEVIPTEPPSQVQRSWFAHWIESIHLFR